MLALQAWQGVTGEPRAGDLGHTPAASTQTLAVWLAILFSENQLSVCVVGERELAHEKTATSESSSDYGAV